MKAVATIELDDAAPERAPAILAALPRVEVRHGRSQVLLVNGTTHGLTVLGGIAPYASATAKALASLTKPDLIPLVVADRLTVAVRRALEEAGCSYADGTGAAHLEGPGFLIHIDPTPRRRDGAIDAPRGLGVVAVRVVQVLLTEAEREWSVTDLAQDAGVSLGEAHKVLSRLDAEGLVATTGTAKTRRRAVRQPTDLLDWLATVPSARKSHARLKAFLYTPDPDALLTRLAFHAHQSTATWAVTGAAAARVMGMGAVTALPTVLVRVPAKPGLAEAAHSLGVEPVESGANVMLLADVGEVGTRHAVRVGPMSVAPPVRIWLDMLGEPRGEDAAALFREGVLGY